MNNFLSNLKVGAGFDWSAAAAKVTEFFQGLSGPGLTALSYGLMVTGVCLILFVVFVKVFNKQTQLSAWYGVLMLLIGGIGAFGVEKPIQIAKSIAETVMGFFGV